MFNKRNLVIVMAILVLGILALSASGVTSRFYTINAGGCVEHNGGSTLDNVLVEMIATVPDGDYVAAYTYTDSNGKYDLTGLLPEQVSQVVIRCSPGVGYSPQIASSNTMILPPFSGTYDYANIDFMFSSGIIPKP